MRIKEKLSKSELSNLMYAINREGFNPCNKYVLGFDALYNLYNIELLKNNKELRISFISKCKWNLESIRKQLESYLIIE